MAARFFLISELGDAGLWLVDTESNAVTRYEASDLDAGATLPDGEAICSVIGLRRDHNYTLIQGVSLAVAAQSKSIAAAFNKVE